MKQHGLTTSVYVYVCMRVCICVCQTITIERLDVGSSYLHIQYISTEYGSSLYMKVIGLRSRLQQQGHATGGQALD